MLYNSDDSQTLPSQLKITQADSDIKQNKDKLSKVLKDELAVQQQKSQQVSVSSVQLDLNSESGERSIDTQAKSKANVTSMNKVDMPIDSNQSAAFEKSNVASEIMNTSGVDALAERLAEESGKKTVPDKGDPPDVSWLEKTVLGIDGIDNDWITNDPSQSNIPIRKRRRNRKEMTSLPKNDESLKVKGMDNQQTGLKKAITPVFSAAEVITDIAAPSDMNNLTDVLPTLSDLSTYLSSGNSETNSTTLFKGRKKLSSGKESKIKEVVVPPVLPDPLAMGKLDEQELNKLALVTDKAEAERSIDEGAEKPSVSRFRKRPVNMSVLEVASQKKAKSNDTIGVYTKQSTRGKKGKRSAAITKASSVAAAHTPDEMSNKQDNPKVANDKHPSLLKYMEDAVSNYSTMAVDKMPEKQPDFKTKPPIGKYVSTGGTAAANLTITVAGVENRKDISDIVTVPPPKKARFRLVVLPNTYSNQSLLLYSTIS